MLDYFGNQIKVGDYVAYALSDGSLELYLVIKLNPKTVTGFTPLNFSSWRKSKITLSKRDIVIIPKSSIPEKYQRLTERVLSGLETGDDREFVRNFWKKDSINWNILP